MPTARNVRGVDIIAYDSTASRFIGIQVKTLSKRNPVPLGTSLEKIKGYFWVIVNDAAEEPKMFILLPFEVKEHAHRGEKDGRISYWLQPSSYEQESFREAWEKIGHSYGGAKRHTTTPMSLEQPIRRLVSTLCTEHSNAILSN